MDDFGEKARSLHSVPLFPLPNVVLFPGAVLPLHIFEERYKRMTADALVGNRQIAMALLKPGWERDYYCRPAIEPIVCVGTILEAERLPDGKYNFLLRGHTRARITAESTNLPYRVADLQPLPEPRVMEIDLLNERHQLLELFSSLPLEFPLCRQFRKILGSPMATSMVADLLAFNFVEEAQVKQELLEEPDVRKRVARVVARMEEMRRLQQAEVRVRPGMNWN